MVVQLPSRANMILMLWIVLCLFLTSFEFCFYFDVFCCTSCQIDVLFPSMARCTIVSWWNKRLPLKNMQMHCCSFYLFNTKQYNNSNWTVGSCVSENLTCWTPSETFLLPFTNYFIYFLFSCISENVSMYKYITFIHVLHRLFNTYYMLDASLNFVYNK